MTAIDPDDLEYCAAQVRAGDPDRFATAMLAPLPARARLIALYAFNLEIAKTRETVREPMLGEIRLQWWRDAIAECVAGSPRRHQVVHPLAVAIRDAGLPEATFLQAIDARARDFDDLPPESEDALAAYVDATGGTVAELAVRCLSDDPSADALSAARAAGRAWAWIGLARGMHAHIRLGRRLIPAARLSDATGLEADIGAARPSDAVRDWARRLCTLAEEDLATVRAARTPKALRPALAPAALARRYAKRLATAGYDPFRADVAALGPVSRSVALIGVSAFGRM